MNSNELLERISNLKQAGIEFSKKMADAEARKAVLDDQAAKLTEALHEALGDVSWDEVGNAIEAAALAAQTAVEDLQQALDNAGVDYQ